MTDIEFARGLLVWLQARAHWGEERGEAGQGVIEWIILVAFMSIVAVGVAIYVTSQINDAKGRIKTQ